jgi:transposase
MLRPIDRTRRDGPLYPGASRTLRDFIAPTHLLVRIDAAFDFTALARDLEGRYHPTTGRPPIHPEIVLRALLVRSLYGVPSNRQLCDRLSENLAWRWFCHLTLEDAVFDHSTLSYFLSRVGAAGLQGVLEQLNAGLAEAGLLSGRAYVDASLIAADVSTADLPPHDPDDPPPRPITGEGVWGAREVIPGDEGEPTTIRLRRYQDAGGRLTLSPVDRDARWRVIRGHATLGYKEHLICDRHGFILTRRATAADVSDVAGATPLLDRLPRPIVRLTADTGYCAGKFRLALARRGIISYIPLHSSQAGPPAGFVDHGDHFVCPAGKRLLPSTLPDEDDSVRYTATAADCQPCPLKATCVQPSRRSKLLWASFYRITAHTAARRNTSATYEWEQRRRQTLIEGIFAHLDRLGGTRACYRGLDRINAHGALTALAHNILKALTRRRFGRRGGPRLAPSGPVARHGALGPLLVLVP